MNEEIFKIFNKVSNIFSIICTTLSTTFGVEVILFAGYLILNIIDYSTGTLKSKINKTESSHKGIIGIIKKFCYWVLIGITFLISFLLSQLGQIININLEFVMLFGWFTLTCLIINESRSIIENLIEIGIDVPQFLKKGLESYNNRIEKAVNNMIEQKDEFED